MCACYQDLGTSVTILKSASKEIENTAELNEDSKNLIKNAMEKLNLSARAYDRILKVSRTIADLEQQNKSFSHHIS